MTDQFASQNTSDCEKNCPCSINCPLGCQDCDHPLCEQQCENAQVENNDYKVCINELVFEMVSHLTKVKD